MASETMAGIPHRPGTKTKRVTINHKGTEYAVHVPADHDGSRVKVEFPDGEIAYTEGFDPAEWALTGSRAAVACPECGSAQALDSGSSGFECSACGARIELRAASDSGTAKTREA